MATVTETRETLFGAVLQLAYAESEIGLRLMDGRSERIRLHTARPTEFIVKEPVPEANGDLRMDLEILSFELVGTSEAIWPGAAIRATAGAHSDGSAKAVYGTVRIPAGKAIEDGVTSEQVLYVKIETPMGVLQNARAIRMRGTLYSIPPVGARFLSQDEVPVLDETGNVVGTLWACANEA